MIRSPVNMEFQEGGGGGGGGSSLRRQQLSTSDVLSMLEQRRKQKSNAKDFQYQRAPYLQAAAVLAGVRELDKLSPVGSNVQPGEARQFLAADLIPVAARSIDGTVMLTASARAEGLRQLGSREAMLAALEANPSERTGPIQEQFEHYLRGNAQPLEQQSVERLADTLQVLLWLGNVLPSLPSVEQARKRLEYVRLLAPFETLASDAVFRGRESELDFLRAYVGVVKPESLLRQLQVKAARWLAVPEQPALSIYGPGGVGKSALVARFMLEHTRLPEEVRTPFSYLDFDRPDLDISDPLTLCAEMIRQVSLQFAGFESLYEFVLQNVRPPQNPEAIEEEIEDRKGKSVSVLADLLGILQSRLGPRPYLVVLDSFEEAQYRGEARAFPFWEVLGQIQQRAPFLRVVISGRAPVQSLQLAGKSARELEISDLDPAAAVTFLQAQGVKDSQLAQRLISLVGAIPLSLKLVASLVQRDVEAASGHLDIQTRSRFWFSASNEVIQGQLYARILSHIHNPQVERLAHPGLVLRRITPQVILSVLNEPCGLGVASLQEAQRLFDELRRETALVTRVTDDSNITEDVLVHRPDLRRIMLKLLVQKAPGQVEKIHRAAVVWYESQTSKRARAELLYHKLQLGQSVSESDVADSEIRFSLQTSISELPVASQLVLAAYGFQVPPDILQQASHEQFEQHTAAQVEDHLPYGPKSVSEAERLVTGAISSVKHASPLFLAAARVAAQVENIGSAVQHLEQGLTYAMERGDTWQVLTLIAEKCWVLRNSAATQPDQMSQILRVFGEYAGRHQNRLYTLQHHLQQVQWAPAVNDASGQETCFRSLVACLRRLGPEELWGIVPALHPILVPHPEIKGLAADLQSVVLQDDGAFRVAAFADRYSRAALRALMNAARFWKGQDFDPDKHFVTPFQQLIAVWPYRVLRVKPPYGQATAGGGLAEAIA